MKTQAMGIVIAFVKAMVSMMGMGNVMAIVVSVGMVVAVVLEIVNANIIHTIAMHVNYVVAYLGTELVTILAYVIAQVEARLIDIAIVIVIGIGTTKVAAIATACIILAIEIVRGLNMVMVMGRVLVLVSVREGVRARCVVTVPSNIHGEGKRRRSIIRNSNQMHISAGSRNIKRRIHSQLS